MLYGLVRWLVGGSYLDVRLTIGIGEASSYNSIHLCMDAILQCQALSYRFPRSEREINDAAEVFMECSLHNAIWGCVACVDGFLLSIQTPSKCENKNVKPYCSGHYQSYDINI